MTWTFCLLDRISTLHALIALDAERDDIFLADMLDAWLPLISHEQ
jgi:hypothetical protein